MQVQSGGTVSEFDPTGGGLDFLWLELTNQCNLECVHCYADSSPHGEEAVLSEEDHRKLLRDAYALGCRRVQFIGGEPTLNRSLSSLIQYSRALGFEFIEVYTNLIAVSDELLACWAECGVHVATSIYSKHAEVHDAVTTRPGSLSRTVKNIARLSASDIPVRASVIEMTLNAGTAGETTEWLRTLGITDIGTDRLRQFGRGQAEHNCDMSELCGNCASGTLCVGPDGAVAPCIMSKAWGVGSTRTETLATIVGSDRLRDTRHSIYEQTIGRHELTLGGCQPDSRNPCGPDCGPSRNCMPCSPNGHCAPNSCRPK